MDSREAEGLIEGIEGRSALRPIDCRCKRKPDARDDAVGAPGVQDLVDRLALVQHHARLILHGDDFEGAHGVEVAQAAVSDGTDAARAPAKESADRGFDQRGGIHAQLPSLFARLGFERRQPQARLALGHSVRGDLSISSICERSRTTPPSSGTHCP